LERLLERGVTQFKFVDRTFNLNLNTGRTLLQFFLDRYRPGLFLHFEMIPDRLPEGLRDLIGRFPPGALQLEIGIQSFNPSVCERISRRQNNDRLEDNFRFLRTRTGVHIHADLIVGLPGESLESFGAGFDRLVDLGPHEIQVGLLKRLRGTPITRHDQEWQMTYNPSPPYEILQNKLLPFPLLQRLRRFARYWDLVGNSGNFVQTTPLIWSQTKSPFASFLSWTDWFFARVRRTDQIALSRLAEGLFDYLTEELGLDPGLAARTVWRDYQRGGRTDLPAFLRPHIPLDQARLARRSDPSASLKRQARHWRPREA